jgi:protein SCO1/2
MTGLQIKIIIVLLAVAGVVIAVLPNAMQMSRPTPSSITKPEASLNIKLLNVELLDQNGTSVKFVSDIVRDRIVAINFIYTDCKTACPVVSAIFAKLQNRLGDKLQKDVRMVSISINPTADTPESLKTQATHFNARPEWVWLTGEKKPVDDLLTGLGVYSADFTNHIPVILVGDPVSGTWTRFDGFTSPETLATKIDELLLARREKS